MTFPQRHHLIERFQKWNDFAIAPDAALIQRRVRSAPLAPDAFQFGGRRREQKPARARTPAMARPADPLQERGDAVRRADLADELDRTDEPFEAYLLEVLSDFQVTIPEIGVVKSESPPIVIITSNRTREIHDALKRRCLYHWVGYPDAARETAIVRAKAPRAPAKLTAELVAFVQRLRKQDLFKSPGVAETLDWASALTELDAVALDPAQVSDTLGVLLKYQDDIAKIQGAKAQELIDQARAELRQGEAVSVAKL